MNRGLKYLDLTAADILPSAQKKEKPEAIEAQEQERLKEADFLEAEEPEQEKTIIDAETTIECKVSAIQKRCIQSCG